MNAFYIPIAMFFLGGIYRAALGHAWTKGNFFSDHARVILEVSGFIFIFGAVYFVSSNLLYAGLAAVLSTLYFAIGNSRMLQGPGNPTMLSYIGAGLEIYVVPSIIAWGLLAWFGYTVLLFPAGIIAFAGYALLYQPFKVDEPAITWNQWAEGLSGAVWWALISYPVDVNSLFS
jgi:hypothetical protein